MRENSAAVRRCFVLVLLTASSLIAGCGNFWQAPGTSTSTGGTASTTTLTASTTTPTTGASVTLTATVSPSTATGTVTFYSDSSSIGSGTLSSGTASVSTSFTTAGTYSLTATYGGSSTYASSTSSAVAVTVSAASSSARKPLKASAEIHTSGFGSSPIDAAQSFSAEGGTYTAQDAEAVTVRSGGSVTLNGTTLESAAGAGYGVLLSRGASESNAAAQFTMTGGSVHYSCSGCENQATVFAVANAKTAISLTDVTVTNETATDANREGTLLTVTASPDGTSFAAKGTSLTGDIVSDSNSAAAIMLVADEAETSSSLTGAINAGNIAKSVSLVLDAASTWTVTGTSYLNTLSGADLDGAAVNNIDGGGHCVYYTGAVNGTSGVTYTLSGGGFLAPSGTTGLACY